MLAIPGPLSTLEKLQQIYVVYKVSRIFHKRVQAGVLLKFFNLPTFLGSKLEFCKFIAQFVYVFGCFYFTKSLFYSTSAKIVICFAELKRFLELLYFLEV